MKVNIMGIKYTIDFLPYSDMDSCYGTIDYGKSKITIRDDLKADCKKQVICHEIIHGILHHLGKDELRDNEEIVQGLAAGISMAFDIKETR